MDSVSSPDCRTLKTEGEHGFEKKKQTNTKTDGTSTVNLGQDSISGFEGPHNGTKESAEAEYKFKRDGTKKCGNVLVSKTGKLENLESTVSKKDTKNSAATAKLGMPNTDEMKIEYSNYMEKDFL